MADEKKELEAKKPWTSKTLWISVLVALSAFYPPASEWISENPTTFSSVLTGIFFALRLVTKGKVSIS